MKTESSDMKLAAQQVQTAKRLTQARMDAILQKYKITDESKIESGYPGWSEVDYSEYSALDAIRERLASAVAYFSAEECY